METGDKEEPALVRPDNKDDLKEEEEGFYILEEEVGELLKRAGRLVTTRQVKIEEEELLKEKEKEIVIPEETTTVGGMSFASQRFKTAKHTDAARAMLMMTTPLEERENLPLTELSKLREHAMKGLETKFGLLPVNLREDQLSNNYNLQVRMKEANKRLTVQAMKYVFYILKPDPNRAGRPIAGDTPVDLMTPYAKVTLKEVKASVKFFNKYRQDYDVQNLQWSQEFLEASSEEDLWQKTVEKCLDVPEEEMGGPVFLFIMLTIMTSSTEDAARSMIHHVTRMNLKIFKGENVDKVASQLRGALVRLRLVNRTPHDVVNKLIDMMMTSSVEDFDNIFKQMKIRIKLGTAKYTAEQVRTITEDNFTKLSESGKWSGASTSPQALNICWGCGKDGHLEYQCPDRIGAGREGYGSRGRGQGGRGGRGG